MRALHKLLLGAALLVPGLATEARADEVDILGQRLAEVEAKIRELDIQLTPTERGGDRITSRLIDGQVLYELKNYEGAATIFLDIVEKYPQSREYPEALYLLAESLYLKRDFLSARRYYEQCVQLGGKSSHPQEALDRLIELSLYTGDYGPVDAYLDKLGQMEMGVPGPNSATAYVKGKYLFFRKRDDEAVATLRAIPRSNQYWWQAQYFVGASLVATQRFGEAVLVFDPLSKGAAKNDTQKRIARLAHMALGRIYYDQGRLPAATLEYSKIPQDSDLYPDALYESAWVAIKGKAYEKAYRDLDLLLTAQPEGPQVPELKLLMGNLQIRKAAFDEARQTFTKTRDRFEAIKKQLDAASAAHGDSEAYYRALLQKSLGQFDIVSTLPPAAAKWVPKNPDLDKLSAVLGDLGDMQKVIGEADGIIAKIERQLDGPARVNIFPELAAARARSLEMGTRLVDIENRLITEERKLIDPVAGAERSQLDEIAREHELLESVRARLDGRARSKSEQIESLLARVREDGDIISGFNQRIEQLIDERLTGVREALAQEKKNFASYKTTASAYDGEAVDVGGALLSEGYKRIVDRFYQVVVRADVGIIDVAWALKQNKTDENSRLVREKKRELKLLDDDFKDVLREQ